jgi:HEAT repeat protein
LSSVVAGLGHLGNPAAIPLILPFSYHPDPGVRFGLAFALGCFADDKRSVSTLLKLMTDKDSEVRDWATFGLGVLGDFDSPEIREALFQNLSDEDEDVQEEAMAGLAKRNDLRALPHVLAALEGDDPSPEALDAGNFLLGRTSDPIEDASECLGAMKKRFPEAN